MFKIIWWKEQKYLNIQVYLNYLRYIANDEFFFYMKGDQFNRQENSGLLATSFYQWLMDL